MYERFKDKAVLYIVCLLEAHPEDDWKMPANEKAGGAAGKTALVRREKLGYT